LRGEAGARLDIVLLNSGAALLAAGRASDLKDGVDQARQIINSGAAYRKLEQLVAFAGTAANDK
jgi:anthranilate phosphoribosyltransferase